MEFFSEKTPNLPLHKISRDEHFLKKGYFNCSQFSAVTQDEQQCSDKIFTKTCDLD